MVQSDILKSLFYVYHLLTCLEKQVSTNNCPNTSCWSKNIDGEYNCCKGSNKDVVWTKFLTYYIWNNQRGTIIFNKT